MKCFNNIDADCTMIKEDIKILKKRCWLKKLPTSKTLLTLRSTDGNVILEIVTLNKRYYAIIENGKDIKPIPVDEVNQLLETFSMEHLMEDLKRWKGGE